MKKGKVYTLTLPLKYQITGRGGFSHLFPFHSQLDFHWEFPLDFQIKDNKTPCVMTERFIRYVQSFQAWWFTSTLLRHLTEQ
jgi:hypothetical protein